MFEFLFAMVVIWDESGRKYEGRFLKGIIVSKEVTRKDLLVK